MPSSNDPLSSVNPGPGKLSVGTVPTSALLAPSGGGGGSSLASQVSWIGDGAWLDGTTNPATNVSAQLTKFITDLTTLTVTHAASNKVSASSPTTAGFADATTATGTTIQALIEDIITILGGVNGIAKIGALSTDTTFVDGYAPTAAGKSSILGLLDFLVMGLGQQIFGSVASISGTAPNMTITGVTLPTTPAGLNLPFSLLAQNITIYNSAHSGNIGTFAITGVGSSTQVSFHNSSGLADAGGNITWWISTGGDRVGGRITQNRFADSQAAIFYPNLGESIQALIEYIVFYIGNTTGAGAVGSGAISGNPNTLASGSVLSQLTALLGFTNAVTSFTRTITSNHTIDDGSSPDRNIWLDSTSNTFNLTLTNPASNTGRKIFIVDATGQLGINPVTLVRFGSEMIDGVAANATLSSPWSRLILTSDGTNWATFSA